MKERTMNKLTRWASTAFLTSAVVLPLVPATAHAATNAPAAPVVQPNITSVSFSGPSGPGVGSPTITVTGNNFGTAAPRGTSDSVTGCGTYTANGKVYGSKLYFTANANFEAGYSNANGPNCIGIIVKSWSQNRVVLKFGNAYGGFAHWYLNNGDPYAISVKTALWGGLVSGLS
jgi:hypothetical protein